MSVAVEDSAAKDQSSAAGRSTARLLRYPLRSATKPKEEKLPFTDSSNSNSATKRGKLFSSVSKSVNVLDLSGKDKPAKPLRRLSGPPKSRGTPAPKSVGNITPISDARAKRSAVNVINGKSDTPVSDVSMSTARKRFSAITSSSYWSSQIKLSESAAKHSISLGFFKLALEAGCEPIHRMTDELKSYVRRHDLSELGETLKELLEAYKIPGNFDVNGSQVLSEGYQLSDDDVKSSSSSITNAEKVMLKKSLDTINADEAQQVKKANSEISENGSDPMKMMLEKSLDTVNADEAQQVKKVNSEISEKGNDPMKMVRKSVPKKAASNMSGSEVKVRSVQKKPQKPPVNQESGQDKKVKKLVKKSASKEGLANSPPEENHEEDKENDVVKSEVVEVV